MDARRMRSLLLSFVIVHFLAKRYSGEPIPVCTSLDGPHCSYFTDGESTIDRPEVQAAKEPWSERLVNMVQRHLRQGLGGSRVSGAFEVVGSLPDAQGQFYLEPRKWLRQPEGWITVGLRGSFEDNMTLSGEITDDQGYVLDACSRFALQRKISGISDDEENTVSQNTQDEEEEEDRRQDQLQEVYAGDSDFNLLGKWHGVYICAGTPTRLSLTLEPDHEQFATQVHGVFDFAVLNNLKPFELTELTKLISESLTDIGTDLELEAAEVQLFVIDSQTGDFKAIDEDELSELVVPEDEAFSEEHDAATDEHPIPRPRQPIATSQHQESRQPLLQDQESEDTDGDTDYQRQQQTQRRHDEAHLNDDPPGRHEL